MSPNKLAPLALLLLAGCDPLSSTGREQHSGDVKVRIADNNMVNEAEAPKGVGAPMAWRVEGGQAAYGAAGQDAAFALRCDRARSLILLDRAGGGSNFGLQVGGESIALDGHAAANGRAQASLPLDSPTLDRMAAPQAQLTLSGGTEPVVIPGGVAIRHVVQSCRTPPAPPTPVVAPPVIGAPANGAAPAPVPSPSPTGP